MDSYKVGHFFETQYSNYNSIKPPMLYKLYLNGIFDGATKQKERRCPLKLLFSQQRKCVLESCLAPAILREIVLEKLSHLILVHRPAQTANVSALRDIFQIVLQLSNTHVLYQSF